ncbi:MAG: hypothetical protein ACYDAY_05580 [Candidatus Dormibacteria bacterium]
MTAPTHLPQRLASLGLAAALATLGGVPVVAASTRPGPAPVVIPLDTYPQARVNDIGGSLVPGVIDDDELVITRLDPEGKVTGVTDDLTLKLTGSGDYLVRLPGAVDAVAPRGGDAPPSLSNGAITFMGHVEGVHVLSAEATLARAAATAFPLQASVAYLEVAVGAGAADSAPRSARSLLGRPGSFREIVTVTEPGASLPEAARQFPVGTVTGPGVTALAQTLESLRAAAVDYTPELPLQALHPLPPGLALTPPVSVRTAAVPVPFRLALLVHLPAGDSVGEAPGAAVTSDSRGTDLRWQSGLPDSIAGAATVSFSVDYRSSAFSVPALQLSAVAGPMPESLVEPPGGGTWAAALSAGDRSQAVFLAEYDAATLHRVGGVVAPVGRPGPGPQRVEFRYVLDSLSRAIAPAASPAAGANPLAWMATFLVLGFGLLNLWWLWSRN